MGNRQDVQIEVKESRAMSTPSQSSSPSPTASPPDKLFRIGQVAGHLGSKPPLIVGVILLVLPVLYAVAYGKGSAAGVMMMAILSLSLITAAGGLVTGAINAPIFAVLAAATCVAPGRPFVAAAIGVAIAFWASFGTASGKAVLVMTPCSILSLWIMIPRRWCMAPTRPRFTTCSPCSVSPFWPPRGVWRLDC